MGFYGKTTFRPAPTRLVLRDQVDSNPRKLRLAMEAGKASEPS
jgi:hypothetical protein